LKLLKQLGEHPWKIAVVLVCVVAGAWAIYAYRDQLSRDEIIAFGRGIPAAWLIVLFLLLPLLGFPISIFLVVMGIRFGLAAGMAISAVIVFLHNLAAYHLIHGFFRNPVRRFVERAGYAIPSIPKAHRVWFTALFAAVHGPPYWVKLYLLALTDVPFRIYFWIGAPVYAAFCVVPIAAGSAVADFNATWIFALVAALIVLPLGAFWLRRRFGDGETERF